MAERSSKGEALRALREGGIVNPARLPRLMRDTIAWLELDLTGLTILTEAASGPYVVTPVLARLSGAERVLALTRDSNYAAARDVIAQTRAMEELCEIESGVEICTERTPALLGQADIITNLGFVRPIDAEAVAAMKPTAVVPLMCEAWEWRPGDVDLLACRRRGIPVLGTNEDHPGIRVFAYVGWLCLKMLSDAQIEPSKSRLVVVSSDKFGRVIEQQLRGFGLAVTLLPDLRDPQRLTEVDALVVADYARDDLILGTGGDLTAQELAGLSPGITVVQFAGRVEVAELLQCGITAYPSYALPAHRMASTLAALGPRPVVELHGAGLKVGELAARARIRGVTSLEELPTQYRGHALAQVVTSQGLDQGLRPSYSSRKHHTGVRKAGAP